MVDDRQEDEPDDGALRIPVAIDDPLIMSQIERRWALADDPTRRDKVSDPLSRRPA